MRHATRLHGPLGWLLLLLLVLPFLTLPPARAEDGLLDKKERRAVSAVALALARKGQREAFEELVDILRSLGTPTAELTTLATKGDQQFARRKKLADVTAEQKKLQKLTDKWAASLPDREPEARAYLAGILLRLDQDQAAAREVLGHVRHGGAWVPTSLIPLLERRVLIQGLIEKHSRAAYAIEVGVSQEPTFQQAYGEKGAVARHKTVEVHVARTGAAGARRILLQVLRAWGLAAELAGLPSDLLPTLPVKVAFHGTHAEFLRSIPQAVAAGRLPAEDAAQAAEHRTYRTKDGFLIGGSGVEAHHQTFVLFDIWFGHARRLWGDKEPLPCLEAGFLNWTMLQMMGCPIPLISWRETEFDRQVGSTLSEKDNETRKYLLKLASAGLAGTRAYMRFLMERRLDPPWRASFHPELGQVRGHDLLKCTIVNEYLLESDLLRRAFTQTLSQRDTAGEGPSAETMAAGLEGALGWPLTVLENDLRVWMLHRAEPGLVQRLARVHAPTGQAAGSEPLLYLSSIRRSAYAGSNPITLEPDLSDGATAHAQYLARYPAQAAAWPDAHEEYADHEGYSPAGARAAASAVIAPGSSNWKAAIDAWMGTFFHRLPLIDPGLLGIGAGLENGMAVLDTASLVAEWATNAQIPWPPDRATDIPLHFVAELPNPIPGVSQATMGYPITLQIYPDPGQPTMEMKLLGPDGRDVPCYYSAPHAPLNPELVPPGAYCLIPKSALLPGKKYTVRVSGLIYENEKDEPTTKDMSWTFQTGS